MEAMMDIEFFREPDMVLVLLVVVIAINLIVLVRSFFRRASAPGDFQRQFSVVESKMADFAKILGGGFADNRREYSLNFQEFRKELGELFNRFSAVMEQKTDNLQGLTLKNLRDNREELSASLRSFEEKFTRTVAELTKSTTDRLDVIRSAVDKKLESIQKDNNEKLEEMRKTVDEKLHSTLEKRLGESFRLVSERLESVQKGLGEMQTLASGVGDLKKVLRIPARGPARTASDPPAVREKRENQKGRARERGVRHKDPRQEQRRQLHLASR
jgi:DNA recombination protein RmuC